jgi:diguanylate cyclase (GGDEF)-like protein
VETALEKAKETGEPFAVLYFDLNRFKAVNDTFGHETGDEFLKYVSARVASILRKPDLVARLGGDEFVVLLHNCDEAGMKIFIERLLENVQRPFKIGKHTLVADLSIGTAFYPRDGASLTELLRRADSVMYQAKQQNRVADFVEQ